MFREIFEFAVGAWIVKAVPEEVVGKVLAVLGNETIRIPPLDINKPLHLAFAFAPIPGKGFNGAVAAAGVVVVCSAINDVFGVAALELPRFSAVVAQQDGEMGQPALEPSARVAVRVQKFARPVQEAEESVRLGANARRNPVQVHDGTNEMMIRCHDRCSDLLSSLPGKFTMFMMAFLLITAESLKKIGIHTKTGIRNRDKWNLKYFETICDSGFLLNR